MTSEREKRRIARQGAQQLKNQPGWDPSQFKAKDPLQRLQELVASEMGETAYSPGQVCEECVKVRQATNDDTALCEKHLAQAMGF
jgi:hypothetical protein